MRHAWPLMVACLAGCPSSYDEPQLPLPLPEDAAVQLTTETEGKAGIRYHFVRSDIAIDCTLVAQLRGRVRPADLDASWFGPAHAIEVRRDRQSVISRRPGRRCDLIRFEHESGEVALLTLTPNSVQHVQLSDEGVGGSYELWPDPGEGFQESRERCSSRMAAVRWSEPIPVGKRLKVDMREVEDGCTLLEVSAATTTVAWQLCTGASEVPLAEGDLIDVTLTGTDNDTIRIDRRGGQPLTMWLGGGPVARTNDAPAGANMRFSRDDACRLERLDCGMIRVPVRLDVNLGRRAVQLRAGERVLLNDEAGSLEVSVGDAAQVPIASAGCSTSVGSHARFFAIERRKRSGAQLASD